MTTYTIIKMDLEKFWCITHLVGWRSLCTEMPDNELENSIFDIGKATFLLFLTNIEEMQAYQNRLRDLSMELYIAIRKWGDESGKKIYLPEDDYNDLLDHIIGLGKDEYERTLNNPELAFDRMATNNFVESFYYCVPWRDDYKKL